MSLEADVRFSGVSNRCELAVVEKRSRSSFAISLHFALDWLETLFVCIQQSAPAIA